MILNLVSNFSNIISINTPRDFMRIIKYGAGGNQTETEWSGIGRDSTDYFGFLSTYATINQ